MVEVSETILLSPEDIRDRADRLWSWLLMLRTTGVVVERDLAEFYFTGWCSNSAARHILDELKTLDFLAGGLW